MNVDHNNTKLNVHIGRGRIDRRVEAAIALAMASPGIRRNQFQIGACLYQRKSLISVGQNSYKTHPKTQKQSGYPYLHAEQQAMFRAGLDRIEGTTLVVARLKKDGSIGLVKPCIDCHTFAQQAGVRYIIYTTNDGWYEQIDLYKNPYYEEYRYH